MWLGVTRLAMRHDDAILMTSRSFIAPLLATGTMTEGLLIGLLICVCERFSKDHS